mgnify:CR=1 FL=1
MIISMIVSVCGLLGIGILMYFGYKSDKKIWNKGACSLCNKGFWKSFDLDSVGSRGYKCTHCNKYVWISFYVDK